MNHFSTVNKCGFTLCSSTPASYASDCPHVRAPGVFPVLGGQVAEWIVAWDEQKERKKERESGIEGGRGQ